MTRVLAHHGSEHKEDNDELELEPGLDKALDLMTSKLMMAINNKFHTMLKHLSHTIDRKRANDLTG